MSYAEIIYFLTLLVINSYFGTSITKKVHKVRPLSQKCINATLWGWNIKFDSTITNIFHRSPQCLTHFYDFLMLPILPVIIGKCCIFYRFSGKL